MSGTIVDQLSWALRQFASDTRLYELTVGDGRNCLDRQQWLVEAFCANDSLQELGARDVIVLSTSVYIDLASLLGEPASLQVSLADGTRASFAGEISEAVMLGCDGGFVRYRLRISPWAWRLGQVRNRRVWQDKSVLEIIDSVFAAYSPLAKWRWSDDTSSFMAHAVPRSYCCQYRESDLDFVRRLLSEEGLGWRFEHTEQGPGMVLFSDSSRLCAVPHDATSTAGRGVRFHAASAVERQDTV